MVFDSYFPFPDTTITLCFFFKIQFGRGKDWKNPVLPQAREPCNETQKKAIWKQFPEPRPLKISVYVPNEKNLGSLGRKTRLTAMKKNMQEEPKNFKDAQKITTKNKTLFAVIVSEVPCRGKKGSWPPRLAKMHHKNILSTWSTIDYSLEEPSTTLAQILRFTRFLFFRFQIDKVHTQKRGNHAT